MTRLWVVLLPALAIGSCLDRIGVHYLANSHCLYSSPAGQGMLQGDLPARLTYKVLLANTFFLQTIHAPNYGTNAALWSLANEFWYYMAFPMLLLAIVGRGAWRRLAYMGALVLLLAFVGVQIAAPFAIWLLGFVVSLLPLTLASRYQKAAVMLGLAQFGIANLCVKRGHLPYLTADLLLGISFSLFLYAIAHRRQLIGSLAYQRLVTRLSGFSYTLYLTHLPFLTVLIGLLLRPWHPWRMDPLHLCFAALVIAATYLYSYGLYLMFERHTPRVRKLLSRPTIGRVGVRQPI